ncbi:MAG TPA: hypothetical protein V6D08_00770 [Candidatus Obscuribacterales bacterium]
MDSEDDAIRELERQLQEVYRQQDEAFSHNDLKRAAELIRRATEIQGKLSKLILWSRPRQPRKVDPLWELVRDCQRRLKTLEEKVDRLESHFRGDDGEVA